MALATLQSGGRRKYRVGSEAGVAGPGYLKHTPGLARPQSAESGQAGGEWPDGASWQVANWS